MINTSVRECSDKNTVRYSLQAQLYNAINHDKICNRIACLVYSNMWFMCDNVSYLWSSWAACLNS